MLVAPGNVKCSSLKKEVYEPKSFLFPHAVLLRQAFAHCGKFLTAASRRSLGRVSVPMWLAILSNQLLIVALVSNYLTNQLIKRELIPEQRKISFFTHPCGISSVSDRFQTLYQTQRVDSHVLLTRSPLKLKLSYDLHVLGVPPAFILSQDQTLL